MIEELQLDRAKSLRAEIDRFKPPVATQLDLLCHITVVFVGMVLDQHIEELIRAKKKPSQGGN